jgi:hypothetical protein
VLHNFDDKGQPFCGWPFVVLSISRKGVVIGVILTLRFAQGQNDDRRMNENGHKSEIPSSSSACIPGRKADSPLRCVGMTVLSR